MGAQAARAGDDGAGTGGFGCAREACCMCVLYCVVTWGCRVAVRAKERNGSGQGKGSQRLPFFLSFRRRLVVGGLYRALPLVSGSLYVSPARMLASAAVACTDVPAARRSSCTSKFSWAVSFGSSCSKSVTEVCFWLAWTFSLVSLSIYYSSYSVHACSVPTGRPAWLARLDFEG